MAKKKTTQLSFAGQVYYVPAYGSPRMVKVERIARKWMYGERMRWDENGVVDGGQFTSPGKVYVSKRAYEHELEREAAWRDTIQRMSWNACPPHLTLQNVRTIREIVGLPLWRKPL